MTMGLGGGTTKNLNIVVSAMDRTNDVLTKVAGDANAIRAAFDNAAMGMNAARDAAANVDAALANLDDTVTRANAAEADFIAARNAARSALLAESASLGAVVTAYDNLAAVERLQAANTVDQTNAVARLVAAQDALAAAIALPARSLEDMAFNANEVAAAEARVSVATRDMEASLAEGAGLVHEHTAAETELTAALDARAMAERVSAETEAQVTVADRARTAATREMAVADKEAAIAEGEAAAAAEAASLSHKNLLSSVTGLVTGIVGLTAAYVGVHELASTIQATAQYGDQVRLLSEALQISTQQASEWIFQGQQVGLSASVLTGAFDGMIRRLQQANAELPGATGQGKAMLVAFHDMGIAVEGANGKLLPTPQIIQNIRNALQGLPESATKVEVILDAFTRGGGGAGQTAGALVQFLQLTNQQIAAMNEQAEKLHLVLDGDTVASLLRFNQMSGQVNASVLAIKLAIGEQLIPQLEKLQQIVIDNAAAWADWAGQATQDVVAFFKNELIPDVEWMLDHHTAMEAAIVAIGAAIATSFGAGSAAFIAISALVALFIDLKSKIDDSFNAVSALGKGVVINQLPDLLKQRDTLEKNLAVTDSGGSNVVANAIASVFRPLAGTIGINLPDPNAGIPNKSDLQHQLDVVNERIATLTAVPTGFESSPGNPNFHLPAQVPDFGGTGQVGSVFDPTKAATGKKLADEIVALQDKLNQAMADGIISYREFISYNDEAAKYHLPLLTTAMAGQLEAEFALNQRTEELTMTTYDQEKAVAALADAMSKGSDAIAVVSKTMIQTVLTDLQKAGTDLFSKPTVEQIQLQSAQSLVNARLAQNNITNQPFIEGGTFLTKTLNDQIKAYQTELTILTGSTKAQTDAINDQKTALGIQMRDLMPGQNETRRQLQSQLDALDVRGKMTTAAADAEKAQLDIAIKARQDQVSNISAATKGVDQALNDLKKNLADEMTLETANQAVLKDRLLLADQNRITDAQQQKNALVLIGQIQTFSGKLADVDTVLGISVIPSYQKAQTAVENFAAALVAAKSAVPVGVGGGGGGAIAPSGSGSGGTNNFYGPVTVQNDASNDSPGSPLDLMFRRTATTG